jgi:hypothetical protein
MDAIAAASGSVNGSLAGKRREVDKLVRTQRLLVRLEFVVQLPHKLTAAVASGDYATAVNVANTGALPLALVTQNI